MSAPEHDIDRADVSAEAGPRADPAASKMPAPQTADPRHSSLSRQANFISKLTMVSRLFGLLRDKVCSYYLGVGTNWSAFWMGFQFPNLFRRIFGEGALTAIFVPVYTRVRQNEGPEAATRLAAATCTLLVAFLSVVTLVGEAVVVPLAFSHQVLPANRLAAAMIAIMLPYCVMVCLVALMGAINAAHERFAAQALAPIVMNVTMCLAAAVPVWWFTARFPIVHRIICVAVAVLLAGIVQIALMIPSLRKSGLRLKPLFSVHTPGVRDIITGMLPMIVGLSAVQFNTFMDTQVAWWLSPDGHGGRQVFRLFGVLVHVPMLAGALGKLSIAQRIYLLPVGVFGVAMATALFPRLSRAAAANDHEEMKRLMHRGLRRTIFLSVPASAGMIIIARLLVAAIYLGGRVTMADVDRAAWATRWFCAGIWAFESQLIVLRVFYAMRDVKTPMRVSLLMVLLNFSLNITLVWFMQEGGLAASTTISAIIQTGILLWILRSRIGPLHLASLAPLLATSLVGTAVMAAAAWGVDVWAGSIVALNYHHHLGLIFARLPLVLGVAVATYFSVAWLLRSPELAHAPFVGRYFAKSAE